MSSYLRSGCFFAFKELVAFDLTQISLYLSNHDHGDRRVRVLLEKVPAGQADDRIWIRADA